MQGECATASALAMAGLDASLMFGQALMLPYAVASLSAVLMATVLLGLYG